MRFSVVRSGWPLALGAFVFLLAAVTCPRSLYH